VPSLWRKGCWGGSTPPSAKTLCNCRHALFDPRLFPLRLPPPLPLLLPRPPPPPAFHLPAPWTTLCLGVSSVVIGKVTTNVSYCRVSGPLWISCVQAAMLACMWGVSLCLSGATLRVLHRAAHVLPSFFSLHHGVPGSVAPGSTTAVQPTHGPHAKVVPFDQGPKAAAPPGAPTATLATPAPLASLPHASKVQARIMVPIRRAERLQMGLVGVWLVVTAAVVEALVRAVRESEGDRPTPHLQLCVEEVLLTVSGVVLVVAYAWAFPKHLLRRSKVCVPACGAQCPS
jgi:hypothetical protein